MQTNIEAILQSDLSELDRVAQAFLAILDQSQVYSAAEIELRKALGDEQGLRKEQIKADTLRHSGEILRYCYLRVTGRKLIHE